MNEQPKRLSPSKETLNLLFARSGNRCAFPGCIHALIDEEDQFIAQVCHIEAALPGGERYNKDSDNESRRKPENLLLLCYQHHIKTNNVERYPVEVLRKMKSEHEVTFGAQAHPLRPTFDFIERVYYAELQKISDQLFRISNQVEAALGRADEIHSDTQKILAVVSGASFSVSVSLSGAYKQQMDAAMTLRTSYRHDLAINNLKELKEKHWNDFDDVERYKLLANLGICYFDIGEYHQAAQYYLDAYRFQPERLRAITLAASAHVILGDTTKATEFARKALEMEPGNADAYNTLLVAEGNRMDLASLIALVPLAYRDQLDVTLAISNEARKKGQLAEAIEWAERGLGFAEGKSVAVTKAYLATLIFELVYYPFDVYIGQVSQDTINKAKYIIELLDVAWAEVKGTRLARAKAFWLTCRAHAKKMMGDLNGCYADMLECAECSPSLQNLHNLAYSAIAVGELDQAHTCYMEMEQFACGEERDHIQMVRSEILYFTERYAEAIEFLEKVTKEVVSDKVLLDMQVVLVAAYKLGGLMEKAVSLNDSLILDYPDAVRPCLERALDERNAGHPDKELEALELSLSRINEKSELLDIRSLAAHLVRAGEFSKAIPLYERITDLKIFGPLTKKLLETYYRAGESKKVLDTCLDLIGRYGPSYELSFMLTDTYLLINDIPAAIQTCLGHLEVYPDDQRIAAKLLLIYEQVNDFDAIRGILLGFNRIDHTLPVNIQFKLTELYLMAGLTGEFYAQSVTCWKRNYVFKEGHECFFSNSLKAIKRYGELVNPDIIAVDMAVILLDDEDRELTFFITGSGKGVIPEEIASDSLVGKTLLGKFAGDEVVISGLSYRIAEVLHSFNFAKRESLRLLQEKYIDSTAFRKMRMHESEDPKVAFQELYAILDRDSKQRQEVEDMYRKRPIPLGAIARGQGENPIKTWNNYIARNSPGIPVMNGQNEIDIALKKLAAGTPIIIDAITLNSVATLGLLSQLAGMGNPLAVSQSSLNVFHSVIREFELSKNGLASVGKENGEYVRTELDSDQVGHYLIFMKNLVDWIRQHCEVLPCRPALEMSAQQKQEMDELYGESFAETLLIAGSSKYLLYSEEWTFRSMAHQFHDTDGFNSFILCRYLVEKRLLSNGDFQNSVIKMISMNYHGIPVNSSILLELIEKTKDVAHPHFQRGVKGIATGLTDFNQAQVTCLLFYFEMVRNVGIRSKIRANASFFSEVVHATLKQLFISYAPSELVKSSLITACNTIFKPEHPFTLRVIELIGEAFDHHEKNLQI